MYVLQAAMYFRLSLLLESRMWGSYVALCDLGEPPDAYQCFGNTSKARCYVALNDDIFINAYFRYYIFHGG